MVLGLGNPIMGDDGAGLAVLDALQRQWRLPVEVECADGGTWGMNLLPMIESAGRLLLLDAINNGGMPGSLVRLDREALPRFLAHKVSPHQIDLQEVLALAELRGTLTHETVAIGVQPGSVEMRHGLSPAVADGVAAAAAAAAAQLEAWGHACARAEAACA
ncbi:MAG: HyaD/HybD family hydrogenase maturation endopeptidase [Gemmatimonadales bacterium]